MTSDSEVRQILIEFLAFANAHWDGKRVTRSLKVRSALIGEGIWNMAYIVSHAYDAALVGEVISINFKKNKNARFLKLCYIR